MSESEAKLAVLGEHTCVPCLQQRTTLWENVQVLKASKGKLPPYLMVVGDRNRVVSAAANLTDMVLLNDVMREVQPGRVNVAVGFYKGTPVAIAEHQMGTPSTEIIIRELLSHAHMTNRFALADGTVFSAPEKYVVRVGSCGGINTHDTSPEETIAPFDVLICDHQVGVSGTDMQALSGQLNYFRPQIMLKKASARLTQLGFTFKTPDAYPTFPVRADIHQAMHGHAARLIAERGLAIKAMTTGNFSKDSLYVEEVEEEFIALRKDYDCGATEMEFSTICRVAKQFDEIGDPVQPAMALYCLGVIPGASFAAPGALSTAAKDVALIAALETLHELSLKHKQ